MNTSDFIFRVFHITNLLIVAILTSPYLPYIPFVDYANISIDCVNSSIDYGNTSYTNFSNIVPKKFDDCVNTLDD